MATAAVAVLAAASCGSDEGDRPSEAASTSTPPTSPTAVAPEPDPTETSATVTSDQRHEQRIVEEGDFRLFVARPDQIDLVWRDARGRPYRQLEKARRAVEADGRTVRLILNAGLYQPGLVPAGLHVEDGVELTPLNLNEGAGNFHLMPNGVFSINDGVASVMESNAYLAADPAPQLAVQSGPMLTVDGAIHPRFKAASTSRFVRNGVGVTAEGQVLFAQSIRPVTLWEFAEFFLVNDAPNSLYLDGSIARMEAPREGRSIFPNIPFAAMLVVAD